MSVLILKLKHGKKNSRKASPFFKVVILQIFHSQTQVIMSRPTTHQTKEDKSAAKALANRRVRAKKAEREHNLLSRHSDQTTVLSRGQARKKFEEIEANRVQLLPASIS